MIVRVTVIGVPDDEMSERVVAIVQPMEWNDAGEQLAQDLRSFTRAALGGLKCPRQFHFRQTLPREPTGKLLKRLLRAEYANPDNSPAQPDG